MNREFRAVFGVATHEEAMEALRNLVGEQEKMLREIEELRRERMTDEALEAALDDAWDGGVISAQPCSKSRAVLRDRMLAARGDQKEAREGEAHASCHDCDRPYGDEFGFPDLIVPFEAWQRITPTSDDGGLLCPSCICKRLYDAGIRCEGAFMSGPIESVTRPTMNALRRVENIELAIAGRDNAWSAVRDLVQGAQRQKRPEHIVKEPSDA